MSRPGNPIAIYGCIDPANGSEDMAVELGGSGAPVPLGISAIRIIEAVYIESSSGEPAILMNAGKCRGLIVYELSSIRELTGQAFVVSRLSVDSVDYHLDGGGSPACIDVDAVVGLSASPSGHDVGVMLARSGIADESEGVEIAVGSIEWSSSDGSVQIENHTKRWPPKVVDPVPSFALTQCPSGIRATLVASGHLIVFDLNGYSSFASIPPDLDIDEIAVGSDGGTLVVLAEPDDVYVDRGLDACDR